MNQAFATFGKRKAPKGAMNRGGRRSPDGSPGPADGGGAVPGAVGGAPDVNQTEDLQPESYVNSHKLRGIDSLSGKQFYQNCFAPLFKRSLLLQKSEQAVRRVVSLVKRSRKSSKYIHSP